MNFVWSESTRKTNFEPLKKSIRTDVLVIGGGMAGLLCAYMLKNNGIDCVLAEANEICSGITKNTTAKITVQHGLIYDRLISQFGERKARLYYEAQSKAFDEYAKICKDIDCDYERKDSFVYSIDDKIKLRKEVSALKRIGVDSVLCEDFELPFPVSGAVCIKNQAQFNPLRFAYEIAKGLPIYENTKVLELMPYRVVTQYGEIRYKKVIVATHFPILNKHGAYFLKLYQHRSYVIALRGAKNVEGMYVDEKDTGLSFRSYGDLLLLGGGAHRTGKNGGNWRELEAFASQYYPSAKVVNRWATQDCMSLDGVPYIGEYSKSTEGIYVATGFNKWEMTSSMVSALLLTDLVQEKRNKFEELFSPSRSMLRPQLAVNAFESAVGLLTPTVPRCPHLGCALKYNSAEHSWDCPCHGSRFTEEGEVIDNPATDDKWFR